MGLPSFHILNTAIFNPLNLWNIMFETSSWRLFEDSLYNRTSGNISDDLAGGMHRLQSFVEWTCRVTFKVSCEFGAKRFDGTWSICACLVLINILVHVDSDTWIIYTYIPDGALKNNVFSRASPTFKASWSFSSTLSLAPVTSARVRWDRLPWGHHELNKEPGSWNWGSWGETANIDMDQNDQRTQKFGHRLFWTVLKQITTSRVQWYVQWIVPSNHG